MKTKLTLLTTLLFFALYTFDVHAQVNINVNVNTLPEWAPAEYIPETRYYYMPELEVYYDIPSKMYIYYHKNGWVRNKRLPKHYHKHSLNRYHKVSLYDIGPNPYAYHNSHRVKYPKNHNRDRYQPTRFEQSRPKPNTQPKPRHEPKHDKRDNSKNGPKHHDNPKHDHHNGPRR